MTPLKKSKKRFWKLPMTILLILEMTSLKTHAGDTQEKIQKIQAGEQAPFTGFLLPKESYQTIIYEAQQKQLFQNEFEQCMTADQPTEVSSDNNFQWGLAGFVMGFVSTAALVYYVK